MAENVKLICAIHEISQIPNSRTYLISIKYQQGQKIWYKPWRFTPSQPVSMEWLEKEIAKLDPWPEADLMQNIVEEKDKTFAIEASPPAPEKLAADIANAVEQHAPPIQQSQIALPPGTVLE